MNMRHLTFRLLQVFLAVVRSGSLSRAAEQLHLTQPTVSLQIKRLTETVGSPLFHFHQGKLELTFAGKALQQAAEQSLGAFEHFHTLLEESAQGFQGELHLGVVTTAQYIVPKLLAPYTRAFPKVRITLNISNRAKLLERFEAQADDWYFFSHPPTHNNADYKRLLKNPLLLLAPRGHWAAQGQSVPFAALQAERFLMREPGSATRMVFEQWLRSQGHSLPHSLQMESNEAIRLSVAMGLGLAVLSEHTLTDDTHPLVPIHVEGFPLLSHWYRVRHPGRPLSQAAIAFAEFVDIHLPEWVAPRFLADTRI
jgi:LysR family transcriptional regulator, low CO2-responsive transcriptional regulator